MGLVVPWLKLSLGHMILGITVVNFWSPSLSFFVCYQAFSISRPWVIVVPNLRLHVSYCSLRLCFRAYLAPFVVRNEG